MKTTIKVLSIIIIIIASLAIIGTVYEPGSDAFMILLFCGVLLTQSIMVLTLLSDLKKEK